MSVLDFSPPVPGRRIDVLAFHTDTPFELTRVGQTLFTEGGGKGCYGVQKLAQQVMIRLFTGINGKRYDVTQGTRFINEVLAGQIRTAVDAARSLAHAKERVISQFIQDAAADSTIPLDERLADLQFLSITVEDDTLHIVVRVVNVAGESSEFKAPITVS